MLDYHKGEIISWNDGRGFGFIEPEDKAKNVFVHISTFKGNGQQPKVEDVVYYQSDIDQQGRVRAYAVYIRHY